LTLPAAPATVVGSRVCTGEVGVAEDAGTGAVRVGAVLSRRRRREQVPRLRRVVVRFSDEEFGRLSANAAAARLTLAAYLAELGTAAVAAGGTPARRGEVERGELLVQLMRVHRLLRGATTNLNQVTATLNATGELPGELTAVAAYVRTVASRVDAVVAAIAAER
jgi:hypothetical protein